MRLIYLDESVRPGRYLLAASEMDAHGAALVRRSLGDLVLSGQRRLHCKSESAARRRVILDAIVELPVSTNVLICRRLGEAASRRLLLVALTRLIQSQDTESTLFIERVDGSIALDQAAITSARQREPVLIWHHLAPHEDPALWVSDAVAWAVGAGGEWRRRAERIVAEVIEITPRTRKTRTPVVRPSCGFTSSAPRASATSVCAPRCGEATRSVSPGRSSRTWSMTDAKAPAPGLDGPFGPSARHSGAHVFRHEQYAATSPLSS